MIQDEFDISKIKLIVGLGNIGKRYEGTRHNVGFMFVDYVATEEFKEEPKFKAIISKVNKTDTQNPNNIIIAKPTTLMNLSGDAVSLISNFYKIKPEEILVVHDDLDIKIGSFKLQFSKGPKIHNGIISIEQKLGTPNFWRLRIGVDGRTEDERKLISGKDYVLSKFKDEELEKIKALFNALLP